MKKMFTFFLACLLVCGSVFSYQAAAAEDYTINLKVAPMGQRNDVSYLNGAVYDIFLKYKLDDKGNYIDPHGGGIVDQPLEKGKVSEEFFNHAKKVGSVTINGADNPVVLEDAGEKNIRGSYIIRPVKRAPGYHLDRHPDGKYAEVEFPLLEGGKESLVQTAEVTLKAIPVEKSNFPLFIKKDANGQPVSNVAFQYVKVGSYKKIDDQNRPVFHKDQVTMKNYNTIDYSERVEVSTNDEGKLLLTAPLKEGIYYIYELGGINKRRNPHLFTFQEGLLFDVFANEAGETKIRFTNIRYNVPQGSHWKEYIFPEGGSYANIPENIFLDAKNEAIDGENFTFYNYEYPKADQSILLPDGTPSKKFSANIETPILIESKVKIPKDYMFYTDFFLLEDLPKHRSILFDLENPEYSGKIEDLSDYSFEYKNFDSEIFKKLQIYHEFIDPNTKVLKTVPVDPAILQEDKDFRLTYNQDRESFYMYFGEKKFREIMAANLGIDDMQVKEFADLKDAGHLVVRYFTKINPKAKEVYSSPDAWFRPLSPSEWNNLAFAPSEGIKRFSFSTDRSSAIEVPQSTESTVKDTTLDRWLDQAFSATGSVVLSEIIPTRAKVLSVKVDAGDDQIKLPGAKFKIYKKGTNKPLSPFDSNVEEFSTDSEGKLTIQNLPYFTEGYEVEEIAAPAGYRLPKARFEIAAKNVGHFHSTDFATEHDITSGSHTDTKITNVKKAGDITDTGTMGTLLFGLAGAGALGAGVSLRRKKK